MINVLHVTECLAGIEPNLNLLEPYVKSRNISVHFSLPKQCSISAVADARNFGVRYLATPCKLDSLTDLKAALRLRALVKSVATQPSSACALPAWHCAAPC